jgi:16S rRNA (uracil1498-N3)-methyltransferase
VNARFYAPTASLVGSEVELPDDEAQHVSRVLRLKAGDSLAVFNGSGREFAAVVASATKTHTRVRLGDRLTAKAELPVALTRAARHERWHRVAVSSAKQCGRAVVPSVAPPIAFEGPASLTHLPAPLFLLVEPGASAATSSVAGLDPLAPTAATLIIGPEGGWTADELQRCAGHAHPLGIGALTLRADAAAVVAATALMTHWKLI